MRRIMWTWMLLGLLAPPAAADSLWATGEGGEGGLYSNTARALGLGDIVTIMIVENTTARNTADLETEKQTEKELTFQGFDRIGVPLGIADISEVFGVPLSANPSFSVEGTSDFEGEGESGRSARISGTVSAQVVEILSNGTLQLEATQAVHINEEMNTMVLTGIIRPDDVRADNTVLSTRIANAEIFYTGRGPLTNVNKRGLFTELWEFIWPF